MTAKENEKPAYATANFLWLGNNITPYEEACILTFAENGFKPILWSTEKINVTLDIEFRNVTEILTDIKVGDIAHKDGKSPLAPFSDIFRYKLLLEKSGWWFDTDCICLKNSQEFENLKKGRSIIAGYEDKKINGAVLNFVDQNIAREAFYDSLEVIKEKNFVINWGDIGPNLITNLIEKNNLTNNVLPKEVFYPVHYSEAMKALDPVFNEEIEKRTENSFVYHYWNEIFKRNEVDKFQYPEKGSYLFNLLSDKLQNTRH